MRRTWIGLALGTVMIVSGSIGRADDVGCCQVECHFSDGAGRTLHSVQRRDMTQAECETRFPDCDATWAAEACGAHPDDGTFTIRNPDYEGE
jgi:hypothetical protein